MENKVRMIVADMLINMDDKLNKQIRELKGSQSEINHINMRVAEVNNKLDREAKIRDMVDNLKLRIIGMERGMAGDIEKAVLNNDQLVCNLKDLSDRIRDVVKERSIFTMDMDKIRLQIKDFENFMNEFRGHHD